jgi:hypothetical protein
METVTVVETPAFTLRGWNGYSYESETVEVTWGDLHRAKVGDQWEAKDLSNCVRDSHNARAVVVYKDEHGVAVLHREWGTTDDQQPDTFERIRLIWYEFA